jgi:hypothetical protein
MGFKNKNMTTVEIQKLLKEHITDLRELRREFKEGIKYYVQRECGVIETLIEVMKYFSKNPYLNEKQMNEIELILNNSYKHFDGLEKHFLNFPNMRYNDIVLKRFQAEDDVIIEIGKLDRNLNNEPLEPPKLIRS